MLSMMRHRGRRGSWLQLIVLRILYEHQLHGYKLLDAINTLLAGRRKTKLGSLYTILRRMEQNGLLVSNWERGDHGLNRRTYTLTEQGIERLRQGKQLVENQRRVLEEMTQFYMQHFNDGDDEDE